MKRNLVKDVINILILILVFFIVYFSITRNEFLYGSLKDWNSQHWLFPEYFRKLFYETHDLFPDFAFNLGAGQNIYNFSKKLQFSALEYIRELIWGLNIWKNTNLKNYINEVSPDIIFMPVFYTYLFLTLTEIMPLTPPITLVKIRSIKSTFKNICIFHI